MSDTQIFQVCALITIFVLVGGGILSFLAYRRRQRLIQEPIIQTSELMKRVSRLLRDNFCMIHRGLQVGINERMNLVKLVLDGDAILGIRVYPDSLLVFFEHPGSYSLDDLEGSFIKDIREFLENRGLS